MLDKALFVMEAPPVQACWGQQRSPQNVVQGYTSIILCCSKGTFLVCFFIGKDDAQV